MIRKYCKQVNKHSKDEQVTNKQAINKQVINKQAINKQVINKQAINKQVINKQAIRIDLQKVKYLRGYQIIDFTF